MNRRACQGLEPTSNHRPNGEPTEHLSDELIERLKGECEDEPSNSPPSSLSGMVAPAAYGTEEPFTTVCELASGSTATVYLAVDRRVDAVERFVAIKHYLPELTERPDFAELFIHEMGLARALAHPHVCQVLDYGQAGAGYYTAMEFLQGEPLSKVLSVLGTQERSQRSPRLIAHLIAGLADGLHAIHGMRSAQGPITHRDVTPNNLFVLYDGSVKVTDFGTAWTRDLIRKRSASDRSYLAPEQLLGGAIDARVDVWALGVVLWELLAGQKLFRCMTGREATAEISSRRIAPPSVYHAEVSAELDHIVLKALARDRSKRYASARELGLDLERYLAQSGQALSPSRLAEWLTQLFPNGAARAHGLLGLASSLVRLPHFPDSDETAPQASNTYTPAAQDEVEHTTSIHPGRLAISTLRSPPSVPLPGPVDTISFKHIPPTVRRPRRGPERSWRTHLLPFGAAFGIVLFGFFAGHAALLRASASGARTDPAPATLATRGFSAEASLPAPESTAARETVAEPPPAAELVPSPTTPAKASMQVAVATPPTPSTAASASETRGKPERTGTLPSAEHGALKASSSKSVTAVNAASTIPTQPGAVYVTTPGGGDVYERGRLLGHAPAEFELSPGWHTLLVKSGADNRTVTVQVPAGAAIMVSVPASKP